MDGYPSVIFDNKVGFEHAIRHLIIDHHVDKVGYVSGPKTNVDAMERLEAYKNVLNECGIAYRDDYVIYGNFEESSETLIYEFAAAHPEMEAIVFANDRMALGGYRAFKKLNLVVGDDIYVVGFDNSSFAPNLNPSLSTVEANAAVLAYQAIVHADDFLKTGNLDNLKIETHFVKRSSCGCRKADYAMLSKQMGLDMVDNSDSVWLEKLYSYLFGDYGLSDVLQQIEDNLVVFIKLLFDMVEEEQFESYGESAMVLFGQIISQQVLNYTPAEKLFNLLFCLQEVLVNRLSADNQKLKLIQLFSDLCRLLALSNVQILQKKRDSLESISQILNHMTTVMFLTNNEQKIPWDGPLKNLGSAGFCSAFLYTFQEVLAHKKSDRWELSKKILLKAYGDEHDAFCVPDNKQSMLSVRMFQHEYMPKDRRVTMVLSPLFSKNEMYGYLLGEVPFDNFGNIMPITFQLSSAIKSMLLLEQQQDIQKKLEQSIEKFKESNDILNEISRSDELTGLYNRRGFLDYAYAAITSKRNRGKKALVAYADMDNLKMINDMYGHDEGDFALRELASILKDTFRSTDIVARFGGDEFVAFAMVGRDDYANIMRRRILEITRRHNEVLDKPYPVEMSTGIWEFECGPEIDIYEVLDMADERLYAEKNEKKLKHGSYR